MCKENGQEKREKVVKKGPKRPATRGGLWAQPISVGSYLLLIGWHQIAEYFPPGCKQATLRGRYAKEMLAAGYVFKSVITGPDRKRRWQVWSYDFLIASFISQKQAAQGYV